MSIIVSNFQHCDEQQFQTLSWVHDTVFSVVKLDLFIRALLLDLILALEKNYAYASRTSCYNNVWFIVGPKVFYTMQKMILFVLFRLLVNVGVATHTIIMVVLMRVSATWHAVGKAGGCVGNQLEVMSSV